MEMDQDDRVVWPRDSLFRYFELLEKLQYNLEERKRLQQFAGMDSGHSWGPGVKYIGVTYWTSIYNWGEGGECPLFGHFSF